ncbi:hypothetical protein D3C76_1309980 [compost metagenome]
MIRFPAHGDTEPLLTYNVGYNSNRMSKTFQNLTLLNVKLNKGTVIFRNRSICTIRSKTRIPDRLCKGNAVLILQMLYIFQRRYSCYTA